MNTVPRSALQPVLLAGGSGTRLWPLSRRAYPKQFVPLLGEGSLFAATLERLCGLEHAAPMVVCNEEQRFLVAEEVRNSAAFARAVEAAAAVAEDGALVTFGIEPRSPATGYGYIKAAAGGGVRAVEAFVEKPDAKPPSTGSSSAAPPA